MSKLKLFSCEQIHRSQLKGSLQVSSYSCSFIVDVAIRSLATNSSRPFSFLVMTFPREKDKIKKHPRVNEIFSIPGLHKPINQPTQILWNRFSSMPVWTLGNSCHLLLLERNTNWFVVWTGLGFLILIIMS